jgi:hypothetical protein
MSVSLGFGCPDFAEQLRQTQLDKCGKSLLPPLIVQSLALYLHLRFKLL